MSKIFAWFQAVRPQSLAASIAPVMIGTAMAYGDGFFHLRSAVYALGVAVCIQIGTNLANDYFDHASGVDAPGHGRPSSAILSGTLTSLEVMLGSLLAFALGAAAAYPLILRAGKPALFIAIISIFSGLIYTAGRWSLARLGLGDIFVLIFFGPVAVAGTYYVQSFEYNNVVILAGLMAGFLSVGILAVNNLRDVVTDAKAGRRTLAVRFGKAFTRMEYLVCILASAFIPVVLFYLVQERPGLLLCSGMAFLAVPLVHDVFTSENPKVLNRALALTGVLLLLQSLVFCILWLQ